MPVSSANRFVEEAPGALPKDTTRFKSLSPEPPATIRPDADLEATHPTIVRTQPEGKFTENGWVGPQELDW